MLDSAFLVRSFRPGSQRLFSLLAIVALAIAPSLAAQAQEPATDAVPLRCRLIGEFPLGTDQTFAWVGGSWIERMQEHDDLELCLAVRWKSAAPKFRNLGWGGDTVRGESRAVFGQPDDGYTRLLSDLDVAAPNVVILGYGSNEAFAGASGKAEFLQRYERLIGDMESRGRKVVLATPPPMESTAATKSRIDAYNLELAAYAIAIVELAERRKLPVLEITLATLDAAPKEAPATLQWTVDGQKLTRGAYVRLGRATADAIAPIGDWRLLLVPGETAAGETDAKSNRPAVLSADLDAKKALHATIRDATLPLPATPLDDASPATWEAGKVAAPLSGRTSFSLKHDATTLATAMANAWAKGVSVPRSYSEKQVRDLQAAIQLKNFLFFQRHRPQNETYLFLFRKHEQGNNAVEIPQFDPLIAQAEAEIAKLATPAETTLELTPGK